MHFNKKQGAFLDQVIEQWQGEGTVDAETAARLMKSYIVRPFDWARLAQYTFITALCCVIIAIGVLVADDFLLRLVERLFNVSDTALCLFFAVVAGVLYYCGFRKRRSHPEKVFGNEALLFLAVLATGTAILFLGKSLSSGSGHFSLLLLLATVVYAIVGFFAQSSLVWTAALVTFGSWFGAETGYVSGWGAYYFGMNYPLRFILFGAGLTGLALAFSRWKRTEQLQTATKAIGLLYLFMALWLTSIFGNYGSTYRWYLASHNDLFGWSMLFGLVAVAAIWYGLKNDDSMMRGYGLTFLFINLYTKFFEYFWDSMHKAPFFLLLALSFWLIGRKAEAIWNLEFAKQSGEEKKGEDENT